jgi:hypothetical protein
MKKTISLIILITINFYYSQSVHEGINYQLSTTGTGGEFLKYSEIQGSPYLTKDFVVAKAACCKEVLPMRYDTYADQIEYSKDGAVYILTKQEPYTKIIFKDSNTTLLLENVNKSSEPKYFVLLADGKNSLLKKVGSVIEKNSTTTPLNRNPAAYSVKDNKASFKTINPVYYLKTDKGIISEIKDKGDVLAVYPDKTNELNTYFKSNKVKFNKEDSLIKLVIFINSLI